MVSLIGLSVCAWAVLPSVLTQQPTADGGLPKGMSVGDGESLFLFWRPTEKSLSGCNVTTPNLNVDMLTDTHSSNFARSSTLAFEDGYCCVRVNAVSVKDNGVWYMWAKSGDDFFKTHSNITVVPSVVVVNRTLSFLEGTTSTVNCGNDNAIYCSLKSPNGKVRKFIGPCQHTVYGVTASEHEGTWLCSFAVKGFVREFKANTELKVFEDDTKEIFLHELPNEYIFYCKTPKDTVYNKMCQVTTPYGLELYLTPGKVSGRYTYYGSKPSHCGVTIPKPLAPREVGSWKCQLLNSLSPGTADVYGGYMTIGKEDKLSQIEVASKKLFWTGDDLSHTLVCHVPYVIEYCWFRSPNGTVYNINDMYVRQSTVVTSQGFKFGDCAMNFEGVYMKNVTGKWTCNIGLVKESVTEMSESIEIIYSDTPIIPYKKFVEGEIGSSVELGCRSGKRKGLKYCRLIRPDGLGLSVDPTKNNSDYSYTGKGFIYGDCGITIHSLKHHDIGRWSCVTKLARSYQATEYTAHVYMQEEKGSLIAVYIVVGIVGLLSLMGISYFVIKKFEIKIHRRQDDLDSPLINETSDSQEEPRSQGRLSVVNDLVRFVRRRSPRPLSVNNPDTSFM